jgi:predicted nucleic acid-binding protein
MSRRWRELSAINDDMVIACTLAAAADYVVSRDEDLLSLGTYEGITMTTPEEFIALLRG